MRNFNNTETGLWIVATHNGGFHADDVVAVAVISILAALRGIEVRVVRTRNPMMLASANIVLDVGNVHDIERGRFDHHQKGGAGERENGIPYATAGLVWREVGEEICGSSAVSKLVDESLIQGIDAQDTAFTISREVVEGVRAFNISDVLSGFNPGWHEEGGFDAAFAQAVDFAKVVLSRAVARAQGLVTAQEVVRKAISEAIDPRVIVLQRFAPWQEIIIQEAQEAIYVLFPSETGDWRIQCVPDAVGSFGTRRALPQSWSGMRDAELSALTGVTDAIFVHSNLFMGGAQSFEGVMRMAELALN